MAEAPLVAVLLACADADAESVAAGTAAAAAVVPEEVAELSVLVCEEAASDVALATLVSWESVVLAVVSLAGGPHECE